MRRRGHARPLLHVGHFGLRPKRELRAHRRRARDGRDREQHARRDQQLRQAHGRRRRAEATRWRARRRADRAGPARAGSARPDCRPARSIGPAPPVARACGGGRHRQRLAERVEVVHVAGGIAGQRARQATAAARYRRTRCSGCDAVSVDTSVTGCPASSNVKASDRSWSIFCHASSVASLTRGHRRWTPVAAAKSCATDSTAHARMADATITSMSEKPGEASPGIASPLPPPLREAVGRDRHTGRGPSRVFGLVPC